MSINISMKTALPGTEDGSSSDVTKQLKIQVEKQADKEIEDGSFLCRECRAYMARADDHLTMLTMARVWNREVMGIFRNVVNIKPDPDQTQDPGFGDYYRDHLCSRCDTAMGAKIVRVTEGHDLGEHFVPGNYFMRMEKLVVRRGARLLDAVNGKEVGDEA